MAIEKRTPIGFKTCKGYNATNKTAEDGKFYMLDDKVYINEKGIYICTCEGQVYGGRVLYTSIVHIYDFSLDVFGTTFANGNSVFFNKGDKRLESTDASYPIVDCLRLNFEGSELLI